jgi:hypothetical protein
MSPKRALEDDLDGRLLLARASLNAPFSRAYACARPYSLCTAPLEVAQGERASKRRFKPVSRKGRVSRHAAVLEVPPPGESDTEDRKKTDAKNAVEVGRGIAVWLPPWRVTGSACCLSN